MNRTPVENSMFILLAMLLEACSSVGAHGPLVTANQTEASTPEHNLVVANVFIDPVGFSLTNLVTRHTETGRVYTFPFVDNVIVGSKRLDVERVSFGQQEVNHHVLFLDLPAGTYQVTEVSFGDAGSNFVRLRYDDLEELFLDVPSDSPMTDGSRPRTADPPRILLAARGQC